MKKALKVVALILFVVFVAIQFYRPDRATPPIVEAATLENSTNVPAPVEAILTRSCNDCHTYKTEYPLYAQVAPVSYFLDGHITEGRQRLNLSEWNGYEKARKRRKLDQMCEQVTSREMPLPSYLYIHWGAKLSDEDIKTLCDWTDQEKARLADL